MVTQVTDKLLATVRDPAATDADIQPAVQAFADAVRQASPEEGNAALRRLGAEFQMEDMQRASLLALICGALIERGADPLTIAAPLIQRLESLFEAAVVLSEACAARMPAEIGDD